MRLLLGARVVVVCLQAVKECPLVQLFLVWFCFVAVFAEGSVRSWERLQPRWPLQNYRRGVKRRAEWKERKKKSGEDEEK